MLHIFTKVFFLFFWMQTLICISLFWVHNFTLEGKSNVTEKNNFFLLSNFTIKWDAIYIKKYTKTPNRGIKRKENQSVLKLPYSSRWFVGLLDIKLEFEQLARHHNIIQKDIYTVISSQFRWMPIGDCVFAKWALKQLQLPLIFSETTSSVLDKWLLEEN